jgi:PAS domain S-box-containing protein
MFRLDITQLRLSGATGQQTQETLPIESQAKDRFGVLPNFFRLNGKTPDIQANLWGFAQAAYLDNPLPSLFKERLFVYLSRFCEVRYCIVRHVGFLLGLGRPSGDSKSPTQNVADVVRLLHRPFPRGEQLGDFVSLAQRRRTPLEELPTADSEMEKAIFAFAGHVFLQTADAAASLQLLSDLLGEVRLQYLILFFAFVRTAHYWTKVHPELAFEDDIKDLLFAHEALAACILSDPEAPSGGVSQTILDELPLLRQQADRAVALLASIVNSSDDAIISKNLDGIITSWNRGAEQLFGYTSKEAIGQPITLIIPAERLAEEAKIIEQLKRGEQIEHFDTERIAKDGSKIDISITVSPLRDAAGRVVGASKVARDITGRKRAEESLAEQARLLQLTNDAILIRDSSDHITYWNRGASQVYGYSSDEALGRVSHELLRTKFPMPLEQIKEHLRNEDRWTGELTHLRKDGSKVVVMSRWALDTDKNGIPESILETNNDITAQKQSEEALRESQDQLRALADSLESQVRARTLELEERNAEVNAQTEALRTLSRRLLQNQDEERRHFARELHDSAGQTLAALGMSVSALARAAETKSPEFAQKAAEAQTIVEQLTREIRTTSYLLHPPLLDEMGLTSAADWFVRGLAERGLNVSLNMSEDFGRLSPDLELVIFRLIQECLTNIHRHSKSKTAAIRIERQSNAICVEVQDRGQGMSPERLAEIQTHGTGVGIRGMRERVRQFKGEMSIESDGSGTRIFVTFPLTTPTAEQVPVPTTSV